MEQKHYADFCINFKLAELYIKKLERESRNRIVLIPAVNELRYAACHLRKSFETSNPAEARRQIDSAERHCKRSVCDSVSTMIGYVNESLYDIKENYSFIPISSYIADHAKLMTEAGEIIDFVDAHTHDDDRETIEDDHRHHHDNEDPDAWPAGEISKRLERLFAIKRIYDAGRPDLIRAGRAYLLKVIGVMSAVVTTTVVLLNHFKNW